MTSSMVLHLADSRHYNEHSLLLWRLKRMKTRWRAERTARLAVHFFDRVRERIAAKMKRASTDKQTTRYFSAECVPGGKEGLRLTDSRYFATDLNFRERSNPVAGFLGCDLVNPATAPETDRELLTELAQPDASVAQHGTALGGKLPVIAADDPLAQEAVNIVNQIARTCGAGF